MVVVGHSFGGAVALNLAAARPDLVAALVLLDPAVGLDGGWMREIADDMLASPDYTDREEAAHGEGERLVGARSTPDELDRELDEHLIDLPDGRVGWRISIPAMMSYWSELAATDSCCRATGYRRHWSAPRGPTRRMSPTNCSPGCERVGPTSRCWISTATTWCPRRSPADTAAVIRKQLERA